MKKFIISDIFIEFKSDRQRDHHTPLFLTFPQASKQRELMESKICKGIFFFLVLSHSQPYAHIKIIKKNIYINTILKINKQNPYLLHENHFLSTKPCLSKPSSHFSIIH